MSDYKNFYQAKTILVTGGAGAIGSNLVEELSKIGAKMVIVFDNLSSGYLENIVSHNNVLFVKGDILDEVKLKRVFFERPQIVFHLAAFFANQNSIDHPESDLMVNGMGTLKLLEYAVFAGVDKFIYASSGCSIYGSEAPLPLKEEFTSLHLSTPYQITKMLGELYCNFFYHHYGLKVVKARFFNSYGPGELPGQYRNVIPNFIYWALRGEQLPITGSGEETRDFTYVKDIVDGLLRLGYFEKAVGKEFNLASGREIKIIELANLVNRLTGNTAKIKFVERRKWDTKKRILASIERAKETVGYTPQMDFIEGVKNTISWFRKNWDVISKYADFTPGVSSAVRQVAK